MARGWSRDEQDDRSYVLADLIKKAWRTVMRALLSEHSGKKTLSLSDLGQLPSLWAQQVDGPVVGYLGTQVLEGAERVAEDIGLGADLLTEDFVEEYLKFASNRFKELSNAVWDSIKLTLEQGYALDEDVRQLAARVKHVGGVSDAKALAIARTEIHAALEAGSFMQAFMADPEGKKTWVATNDTHTRPTHEAADGQVQSIHEKFVIGDSRLRFPGDPQGSLSETINCVIDDENLIIDASLIKVAMRSRYEGQIIVIRTSTGDTLTVTPNHPVLTARGWVAAQELQERDYVLRGVISRHFSQHQPTHRPTKISEIYSLPSIFGIAQRKEVPANFHGEFRTTEINVIAEDWKLGLEVEPAEQEEFAKFVLSLTDWTSTRQGSIKDRTLTTDATGRFSADHLSTRDVSVVCTCPSLFSGFTRHDETIRFFDASNYDVSSFKHTTYCPATNIVALTNGQDGFTVAITRDYISNITRESFSGHVYNLSTTSGWYTGNNIILGNCRCTVLYDLFPDDEDTTAGGYPWEKGKHKPLFHKPNWDPKKHPRDQEGKWAEKYTPEQLEKIAELKAAKEAKRLKHKYNDRTPAQIEQLAEEDPDRFLILPREQRGKSGDGYLHKGPSWRIWGKYGAAGALYRAKGDDGEDRYLLIQRGPAVSNKGKWQLAGGAIDQNESSAQGVARETYEELNVPQSWLDTVKIVGKHKTFQPIEGMDSDWRYTNIAAEAPTMFEPKVDHAEVGDAKWLTRAEIEQLMEDGDIHPSLTASLPKIFRIFDTGESTSEIKTPLKIEDDQLQKKKSEPAKLDINKLMSTQPFATQALVAAGAKWEPEEHPRDIHGRFIHKGPLSLFFSKKAPTLGEYVDAVKSMDQAQWDKLTPKQKDRLKTVAEASKSLTVSKGANAQLKEFVDHETPVVPKPLTVAMPLKTPTPFKNPITTSKPSPKKMVPAEIHKQHKDGIIVAVSADGKTRLKWSGSLKKYQLEQLGTSSISGAEHWTATSFHTKADAYKIAKDGKYDWRAPLKETAQPDEPVIPTPTTSTETKPLTLTPGSIEAVMKAVKPNAAKMTQVGKAATGVSASPIYIDENGQRWLVRRKKNLNDDPVLELDRATSKLQQAMGLLGPKVYVMDVDGQPGAVQAMFDAKDSFPSGFSPKKVSQKNLSEIQAEQVLDWLIGNNDAHSGQFITLPNGRITSIDKGHAFRYYANDKLDPSYAPWSPLSPNTHVYQPMWKAYESGDIDLDDPSGDNPLGETIKKTMAISDDDIRAMFHEYAVGAAKNGWLGAYGNDPEKLLDAIVERKHKLATDFQKLYDTSTEKRQKKLGITSPSSPKIATISAFVTELKKPDVASKIKPGQIVAIKDTGSATNLRYRIVADAEPDMWIIETTSDINPEWHNSLTTTVKTNDLEGWMKGLSPGSSWDFRSLDNPTFVDDDIHLNEPDSYYATDLDDAHVLLGISVLDAFKDAKPGHVLVAGHDKNGNPVTIRKTSFDYPLALYDDNGDGKPSITFPDNDAFNQWWIDKAGGADISWNPGSLFDETVDANVGTWWEPDDEIGQDWEELPDIATFSTPGTAIGVTSDGSLAMTYSPNNGKLIIWKPVTGPDGKWHAVDKIELPGELGELGEWEDALKLKTEYHSNEGLSVAWLKGDVAAEHYGVPKNIVQHNKRLDENANKATTTPPVATPYNSWKTSAKLYWEDLDFPATKNKIQPGQIVAQVTNDSGEQYRVQASPLPGKWEIAQLDPDGDWIVVADFLDTSDLKVETDATAGVNADWQPVPLNPPQFKTGMGGVTLSPPNTLPNTNVTPTGADISHLSPAQKSLIKNFFNSSGGKWHNKPEAIWDALQDFKKTYTGSDLGTLTDLQIFAALDSQLSAAVPQNSYYSNKMKKWLGTSKGLAYVTTHAPSPKTPDVDEDGVPVTSYTVTGMATADALTKSLWAKLGDKNYKFAHLIAIGDLGNGQQWEIRKGSSGLVLHLNNDEDKTVSSLVFTSQSDFQKWLATQNTADGNAITWNTNLTSKITISSKSSSAEFAGDIWAQYMLNDDVPISGPDNPFATSDLTPTGTRYALHKAGPGELIINFTNADGVVYDSEVITSATEFAYWQNDKTDFNDLVWNVKSPQVVKSPTPPTAPNVDVTGHHTVNYLGYPSAHADDVDVADTISKPQITIDPSFVVIGYKAHEVSGNVKTVLAYGKNSSGDTTVRLAVSTDKNNGKPTYHIEVLNNATGKWLPFADYITPLQAVVGTYDAAPSWWSAHGAKKLSTFTVVGPDGSAYDWTHKVTDWEGIQQTAWPNNTIVAMRYDGKWRVRYLNGMYHLEEMQDDGFWKSPVGPSSSIHAHFPIGVGPGSPIWYTKVDTSAPTKTPTSKSSFNVGDYAAWIDGSGKTHTGVIKKIVDSDAVAITEDGTGVVHTVDPLKVSISPAPLAPPPPPPPVSYPKWSHIQLPDGTWMEKVGSKIKTWGPLAKKSQYPKYGTTVIAYTNDGKERLVYHGPYGSFIRQKWDDNKKTWTWGTGDEEQYKLATLAKKPQAGYSYTSPSWFAVKPAGSPSPSASPAAKKPPTIADPLDMSVTTAPPSGTTDSATAFGTNGDISHLSDAKKQAIYQAFKKQPATYLSSPAQDIYAALITIADDNNLTKLQALRVIDLVGAAKVKKADEHLFEKKMIDWLKTPQGYAIAHNLPIPVPDAPKFSAGVAGKIPTFEESNKYSYSVKTTGETTPWWKKIVASHGSDWTASQKSSLTAYTGGIYHSINAFLYGKVTDISTSNASHMNNIQAGMKPSIEPILLHRGVGFDAFKAKNHNDLLKMVGQTRWMGGFGSSSVGGHAAFSSKPVLIEVEAPPGTPMAWLKPISHYGSENEMLLAAGLYFRIISVKQNGYQSVVRVRVVPKPEDESTIIASMEW